MRFTDDELHLIKSTFGGNEALLKVLRKVFLPEYDPTAPLGQVIDLWLNLDLEGKSEVDREIRIRARNEMIMHTEQMILQLKLLSEREETVEEALNRKRKDSAK